MANDHVTAEHLTSLVAPVQQHLSADEGDAAAATRAFFTNTRLHLDEKKKADDDASARFKEIEWASAGSRRARPDNGVLKERGPG